MGRALITEVIDALVQPPQPVVVLPSLFFLRRLPALSAPTEKYAMVDSVAKLRLEAAPESSQYGRKPKTWRRSPEADAVATAGRRCRRSRDHAAAVASAVIASVPSIAASTGVARTMGVTGITGVSGVTEGRPPGRIRAAPATAHVDPCGLAAMSTPEARPAGSVTGARPPTLQRSVAGA